MRDHGGEVFIFREHSVKNRVKDLGRYVALLEYQVGKFFFSLPSALNFLSLNIISMEYWFKCTIYSVSDIIRKTR